MADVFLSYVRRDRNIARLLAGALEESGFSVWWDRNIQAGSDFSVEIEQQLVASGVVVVLWSVAALDSQWVRDEASYARDQGKLVPIRLDATDPPLGFRQIQTLDFGTWRGDIRDPILRDLSTAIGQTLKRGGRVDAAKSPIVAAPRVRSARALRVVGIAVLVMFAAAMTAIALRPSTDTNVPPAPSVAVFEAVPGASESASVEKSIAVLPFADLSETKDQAYFADGMAEEILDRLANVPGLRVIGRTSSFQFRGRQEDLRTIGASLGVAHLVEGSVRRSGGRVRVTVQLIRTSDGAREWSESYDRPFGDVLAVQAEIATGVARALQTAVEARLVAASEAIDVQAYDAFLRGLHAFNRYDQEGFEAAETYLEQALGLAPDFVPAAEQLAWARFLQADFGYAPAQVGFERARRDAERLLELNPGSVAMRALLARIRTDYDWDWDGARQDAKKVVAAAPQLVVGHFALGFVEMAVGRFDEAARHTRIALSYDPLNPDLRSHLGNILYRAGDFARALEEHERAIQISPVYAFGRQNVAYCLLALGQVDAALDEMQLESDDAARLAGLAVVYHALGRHADSDDALDRLVRAYADSHAWEVASVYAYRAEVDPAIEWLERARRQHDFELIYTKGTPHFRSLEGDARFKAFLQKMNMPS